MGIIIPPSIIFIVYGYLMNLSISDLFIAGIIPGALMLLALMTAAFIVCSINGWGIHIPLQIGRILKNAFGAWLGFAAIALVLYGIYTGKFSPTEAAGVTVGFCLIVGLISYPLNRIMHNDADTPVDQKTYRDMMVVEGFKLTEIPSIVMHLAQITGILAPLIGISVVMQQNLYLLGAQAVIGDFVTGMGGYHAILFTAIAIVFVAGMILDSLPVTIILAPILVPIAASVGVDPIHFSVIFLVGASIGFITPPYGLNLYVASGVTGVPYFRLLKFTVPYLIALISVWILVALTPSLALMLL